MASDEDAVVDDGVSASVLAEEPLRDESVVSGQSVDRRGSSGAGGRRAGQRSANGEIKHRH